MRTNMTVQVFHRTPEGAGSTDLSAYDIGTSDSNVIGLGGSGEFQIEADETVTYFVNDQLCNATESAITFAGGEGGCAEFIYIKHTGYTASDKLTETSSNVTIGVGGVYADGGFTLAPGEAILLHDNGGSSDSLGDYQADSSSGNIYLEIRNL